MDRQQLSAYNKPFILKLSAKTMCAITRVEIKVCMKTGENIGIIGAVGTYWHWHREQRNWGTGSTAVLSPPEKSSWNCTQSCGHILGVTRPETMSYLCPYRFWPHWASKLLVISARAGWPIGTEPVNSVGWNYLNFSHEAINCTHIGMKAPLKDESVYGNRKHFSFANVQMGCGAKIEWTNLVARCPGST